MSTRTVTKLHAVCPHCDELGSTLNHLKVGQRFGPWYCDSCSRAYWGVFDGEQTVLEKDPNGRRMIKTLVLLEFPQTEQPLRFLVEGARSVEQGRMDRTPEYGNQRYYYEEHSCPTNWLRNVVMVGFDGDTDPHGFLRYVRDVDKPDLPDNCMEEDEALTKLFPEMLSKAPVEPDP